MALKTKRKRPLKGRVTRGCEDHRTQAGKRYTSYLRALAARHGELPESTRAMQRSAGRLAAIELPQLEAQLDDAVARGRTTEVRRLRRSLTSARILLMRMEEKLEAIAAAAEPDLAKALAGFARRANGDGEAAE